MTTTYELNVTGDSGPISDSSYFYGVVGGLNDSDGPEPFAASLVYDYIKGKTDLLYPTLNQFNSLDGTVLKQSGAVWDGESMIARGFADADGTDNTDLVTYGQMQVLFATSVFDIAALNALAAADTAADLMVIYDNDAATYKSITPAALIASQNPDLDFQADAGGALSIDLDDETLTLAGGTGIATTGAANTVTFAVTGVLEDLVTLGAAASDGQIIVATGAGAFAYESGNTARTSLGLGTGDSPQFTALTLTGSPLALADNAVVNWGSGGVTATHVAASDSLTWSLDSGGLLASTTYTWQLDGSTIADLTSAGLQLGAANARVTTILDEDAMGSNSATALATQQSIKAYVDAQVTAQDLDFAGDAGTGAVDLDTQAFTLATSNNSLATSAASQTLTIALANVLEDIDTLGPNAADSEFLVGTGAGALAWESGATARASLGVTIGSDVQAYSAVLDDLNTLGAAASDGQFIVATGAGAFAYESGATARASIGIVTGATDNALLRADGAGGATLQGSGIIVSDTVDITAYDATNDGNPVFAYGASAAERLTITPTYDGAAQTLNYVLFQTDVASVAADKGLFRFSPDGTAVLDIDDGGINLAASKGISIAGTDILTDAAGTATLSNIDALDATTETTIETAIDTLGNLASVQSQSISLSGSLTVELASTINQDLTTDAGPQFASIELSHATQNTLTASGGIVSIEGVAIPTISSSHTLSGKSIDLTDNTLVGSVAEFNTALESATFGTFAAAQTDNAVVRADGTAGLLQTSALIISDTADLTAYDATNDGNPVFAFGAAAAERLTITPTYDGGAQTLDYVLFQTDLASATADKGLFRFSPDGTSVLDIDDGGINLAASKGISIAGTDILTDAAGTATLSNIDVIDATTGATIEAGITTLASLTSIQGVSFTMGAYAATILNTANEAAFKAAVNLEIGTDVQAQGAVLDDLNALGANSADSEFLVGTGAGALAWESGATARASIGIVTGGTDNALLRADGAGGSTMQGSGATLSDNVDLTLYDATNDGNPMFAFGASATERLTITPTYDGGAQTLDYVLFQTDAASATANKGLFRFNVDGTDILDIDDGGIDLDSGMALSINGTDVLSGSALGSGVTSSSLTSVGTLAGLTASGAINFGGADDFEIPNSATPTVDTDGQIALDTTVTDFSHGILKFYGGEEQWVLSLPIAQIATPSNGAVPVYNATNDEFELSVPAGSGDVTAASTFGTDNVLIRSDGIGKGVQSTGITVADTTDDMDLTTGNVQTGGQIIIDVDGSAIGADGALLLGAASDAAIYWDGSDLILDPSSATAGVRIWGPAAQPGLLTLQTRETTVVDGDVLGRINFQAPLEADGTDAIAIAAAIWAEADATFDASTNTTDIIFATGQSEAATEKMRLLANGRLDLITYGLDLNALGDLGGGTDDIDWSLGEVVTATVSTSTQTFTFSGEPPSGTQGKITLYLTNGGSQTVNWPATVDWAGGTEPTLTTSGIDILVFTTTDGGTTHYGFSVGLDMQSPP